VRYPVVEALTALLALVLFTAQAWPVEEPCLLARRAGVSFILLFLVPVAAIDLRHRIIPNAITLPGLGLALALSALPDTTPTPAWVLAGAATGAGVLLLMGLAGRIAFHREAMGMGDVKLMAMGGAMLGTRGVVVALVLSFFAGAVHGMVMKLKTGQSDFPFGPALCFGIIASYIFGPALVNWYLSFLS
jgi:leader peptidase (prepilin peptidase)/N-methyltransferase